MAGVGNCVKVLLAATHFKMAAVLLLNAEDHRDSWPCLMERRLPPELERTWLLAGIQLQMDLARQIYSVTRLD